MSRFSLVLPFGPILPKKVTEFNGIAPYFGVAADAAFRSGRPTESGGKGNADPGLNALRLELSQQENVARLTDALNILGPVVGMNNHMGSAFTEREEAVRPIMELLSERDLTFVDSRTSSNSCAFRIARSCGVRAMENGAFLDSSSDESYLPVQMKIAGQTARHKGLAIAIAHAHAATIHTLPACLQLLEDRGVMLSTIADAMDR